MRKAKSSGPVAGKRYFVRGRVQGVGFRYFVERVAVELGVAGYTRNLEDGSVEVYAIAAPEQLRELSGYLWKGPRLSDVRGVDEQDAEINDITGFHIEYFS